MNVQDNMDTPADQTDQTQTTQQTQDQTTDQDNTADSGQDQVDQTSSGEQTDDKPRDDKGRYKGVQPRIDELTRARREAERERDYWRQVAQVHSSVEAANQKPVRDKFDSDEAYVDALVDWKTEQALSKRMEQDNARKVVETRAQTHIERVNEAKKTIADFDSVVGASEAPISPHIAELIQDSDVGPKLMYHFAKNPGVLESLNSMSERNAAKEFGKLEDRLSSAKSEDKPTSKKVTSAPTPPNANVGQGKSTTQDLSSVSMDDYIKTRKAQGARWSK